jgi:hypothetical protein
LLYAVATHKATNVMRQLVVFGKDDDELNKLLDKYYSHIHWNIEILSDAVANLFLRLRVGSTSFALIKPGPIVVSNTVTAIEARIRDHGRGPFGS